MQESAPKISKLGLLGASVSNSKSKELYDLINLYSGEKKCFTYELISVDLDGFIDKIKYMHQDGYLAYNITIPYKFKVEDNLVNLRSKTNRICGNTNLIVCRDGIKTAHNADFFGVKFMISHYRLSMVDKNILILGTGGISTTFAKVLSSCGGKVVFASTKPIDSYLNCPVIQYSEMNNLENIDYIVNGTPNSELEITYTKSEFICLDSNYRQLIHNFQKEPNAYYDGFCLLVSQAIKSFEIIFKTKLSNKSRILKAILRTNQRK